MAYTTINKSTDYFNTKLYTGTGSSQTISGVGFQPDFTWIKLRSGSDSHSLQDVVRGANKHLRSDTTAAESQSGTAHITSWNSDGFVLGSGDGQINGNSSTYVSWNWKANGVGSSNSDGTITSSVSANTTAGFSIVKWNADNQNPSTIGHGLGVAPKVIIMKETGGVSGWVTGGFGLDWSGYVTLNSNAAFNNDSNDTSGTGRMFSQGGNEPTSTIWYTNSGAIASQNGTAMIAYCFAEKQGYSKFGSYTANGSADGIFVYTGFAPKFIILKRTDTSGYNWVMYDDKRNTYNPWTNLLLPNLNNAEITSGGAIDFLSNGFKLRSSSGANPTTNQGTIIYMAFGQSLVGSNNVPCTAR